MSRTKHHKNQKANKAGKDLWSKRPLSGEACTAENKKTSRRIERKRNKKLTDGEQDEY